MQILVFQPPEPNPFPQGLHEGMSRQSEGGWLFGGLGYRAYLALSS